jgi:hypothetical protein
MLLNIGAARRLASGRKQLPTFKQGKVNARKYLAQQTRMISVGSRRLQKKLNTSFRKDLSIILDELASSAGPNYAESVRRKTVEIQAAVKSEIKKLFTTLVESNDSRYKPVLSKAVTDIGFGFNRPSAIENWVDSYFEEREVQFANISERMTNRILTSVEIDQLEGVGVDQIRRNLRGRFTEVGKNQAALIARTETHNAAGYAQNAYHQGLSKDLGISMQKQWVATLDARTRRAHGAMNGVQVGIDEDFSMPNGSLMAYTGDSRGGAANVVNCRCAIVYIDVDDDVIDEKIPDVDEKYGVALRADGRPLGLSDYQLDKKYSGLGAGERTLERFKAKDRIKATLKDNSDSWSEAAKKGRRFRGRNLSQYGVLDPLVSQQLGDAAFIADEVLNELSVLSDLLRVPKLRGITLIKSGNSLADMGDGVMGINSSYIDKINDGAFGKRNVSVSTWKLGDNKADRPFTAESYTDNYVDDLRSTMYHEFGHLVHQTHKASDLFSYYNPPVEKWMKNKRLRGTAATRYADTNAKEWFAENFALWAAGKDELVTPRFVKLINAIKNGADLDGI